MNARLDGLAGSHDAPVTTMSIAMPGAVLLVGPLPPPSGGMANQTMQLASLLGREDCQVTVVRTNAPYRPRWVGNLRGVRALLRLLPYLWRLWRGARHADVAHIMANSGWAWHLFAAPAVWIAWASGLPVVLNYRGGDASAFFDRHFRCVRPTLSRVARVVVPSGFLAEVFQRYGIATTIVPNIVNLEAFYPALTVPLSPHVIVTRNLEAIYDVGTAIRAFALVSERFPAARMTVAGSGPALKGLQLLAAGLRVNDRVTFAGPIDNAKLPDLYRSASIVVNASLVDNMPISLLEAMASGVPIVSTRVGGIPHLVEDGVTALLVEAGDAPAMAAAISSLVGDPQRAAAMARNAAGVAKQ
ncbi:MAG: glycosyltransferase family 4 protein, partial [Lysobacterales bacterium]